MVITGLFALSLLCLGGGYALGVPALRLVGVFGALFLGVGTAPLQLSSSPDLATRLGVAGLVGLTVITGLGGLMGFTTWHPLIAGEIIGGVAGAVHALAARRAFAEATLHGWRAKLRWPAVELTPSVVCTVAGTAIWLGSAIGVGHVTPGIAGFLPKISPAWYVGLVLLLVAITLARGEREAHVALAVVSLVLATTLTPALVYGLPRAETAYKHVDLVQWILRTHHVDPALGIYPAYSGFFSAIAWMCHLADTPDPLGVATYWPVVMAFVRVAGLRLLFGRVISSRYGCWAMVSIAVLVDSIGADYFSPQSVGFAMALGMFALVVRGITPPPLGRRSTWALLVLSGCAIAITHELSPFMVAGVFIILAIQRQAVPRLAAIPILVPAVAFLIVNRKVLGPFVSLNQFLSVSNFAPPPTPSTPGLERLPIVGLSSDALFLGLLVLILMATVGFVRNIRTRWAWAYGLCPVVGVVFIAVNPYGNEGIFRTALFGIPWLAILAAHSIGKITAHRRALTTWVARGALLAGSIGLLGTFVIGEYGLDGSSVLRAGDVAAIRTFEAKAPQGSLMVTVGFGENTVSSQLFGSNDMALAWDQVVTQASLTPGRPDASDLVSLAPRLESYIGTPKARVYALWSPALLLYSEEYGLQTARQSDAWLRLLLSSDKWQLLYTGAGSYLFGLA